MLIKQLLHFAELTRLCNAHLPSATNQMGCADGLYSRLPSALSRVLRSAVR